MVGFQVVGTEEAQEVAPPNTNAAQRMLLLALGQLSKRALAGISDLFSLIGLASVWALWRATLDAPNATQLVGIGMYSVFLLILEVIRRK